MTLKEFFAKARRGRKWMVSCGVKQVRCADGLCPLAAVTGLWAPGAAAKKLKIAPAKAWRIASAADYSKHRDRKWLLKNLGVK